MTTYVLREGKFYDKKTGAPMVIPERDGICAPMVCSDTPEYRSPIDGRLVSGRVQRREDLKRNNCVEIDPPAKPRGYKNPRFAKKYGLPLNQE